MYQVATSIAIDTIILITSQITYKTLINIFVYVSGGS